MLLDAFDYEYGSNVELQELVNHWKNGEAYGGYILVGPSGCGKTTLLKELQVKLKGTEYMLGDGLRDYLVYCIRQRTPMSFPLYSDSKVILLDSMEVLNGCQTTMIEIGRILQKNSRTDTGDSRLIICSFEDARAAWEFHLATEYPIIEIEHVKPDAEMVHAYEKKTGLTISHIYDADHDFDSIPELRRAFQNIFMDQQMGAEIPAMDAEDENEAEAAEAGVDNKEEPAAEEEGRIWVTSDLHIGHNREFVYQDRGFADIEEHDRTLVANWNELVHDEDTVYILGDILLKHDLKDDEFEYGLSILRQLKGSLVILQGNHDSESKLEKYRTCANVAAAGDAALYLNYPNKGYYHFYLSHYPTLVSHEKLKHMKTALINLYGHTHQTEHFYKDHPYMYCVGLDAHEMKPVLLDEILQEVREKVQNMSPEERE